MREETQADIINRQLADAETRLEQLELKRDEQDDYIEMVISDAEVLIIKLTRERDELEKPVDLFVYHISQTTNNGWETYDSAVVIACDATRASKMDPGGDDPHYSGPSHWTDASNVTVRLIGCAAQIEKKPRVVCKSYNAG